MRPQANFTRQLAIIAVFAASCVIILVYLWGAFGGNIPLKPKNYQVSAEFPDASNLALNADVRISGVNVGHVISTSSSHGATRVVFDLKPAYAPLPVDAHAMLRQKTAFGEIYVDVTPGDPRKPKLPEGGTINKALISPSVELDEIFRTFDPPTRTAFRRWFQEQAVGLQGRGRDLSDAIGNTPAFAESTDQLLKILNAQQGAVQRLVSNTGVVFDALSERRGQLRGAIKNWNTVLATLARRNTEIEGTFKALPAFEREGSATMARLAAFAKRANPLVTQLRPAARALGPTVQQVDGLAPDFDALMHDLDPLLAASKKGLPAVHRRARRRRRRVPARPDAPQPGPELPRGAQGRLHGVHRQRDRRDAGVLGSPWRGSRRALPARDDAARPGRSRPLPRAPGLVARECLRAHRAVVHHGLQGLRQPALL